MNDGPIRRTLKAVAVELGHLAQDVGVATVLAAARLSVREQIDRFHFALLQRPLHAFEQIGAASGPLLSKIIIEALFHAVGQRGKSVAPGPDLGAEEHHIDTGVRG